MKLTDTQYRVLGDLVAGGYITTFTTSPRAVLHRTDGTTEPRSVSITLVSFEERGWLYARSLSVGHRRWQLTDAGRAAYAAEQARREATGTP